MKSPEKVKEVVGIYPLVPAYLPDDFDTIIYQVICWNVGKNSVSDSYDTYSPASYPHTIFYGTGNRSIIIDERILEKDTPFFDLHSQHSLCKKLRHLHL